MENSSPPHLGEKASAVPIAPPPAPGEDVSRTLKVPLNGQNNPIKQLGDRGGEARSGRGRA